ncbi:hypothetical protein ES711_02375 [Gelidibacter salicanalis]|uniref:Uncharacterized protein n=1 Tax=Gelidibacter salicanalis TaxID=291193 RepID=A0A5C7AT48_9FLAO|nr:hypothetical protein [Gelidibacter salicanalis]TXE10773.1 hypothetical protein ES711_02375 [Gelidibacter salicanalis]
MAEIKIKKKQPIWPWILLIVAILALLYFLFLRNDDDDTIDDAAIEMTTSHEVDTGDDSVTLSAAAESEMASYISYINDDAKMGIDHVYTNNALNKLIDATQALAKTLDVDVNVDLTTAKENTASITEDPYEVDHADKIQNAGTLIVKALKTIQSQKFPDLNENSNDLENALIAIKPSTKTLEQKDAVKNFFEQAGELLTKMKNR